MSLPILVAQDLWQEFDNAWRENMDSEEPVDELLVALRVAGDKKRISRCLGQAREHAALLEAGGRPADAANLMGTVLVAGGNPAELTDDLLRFAELAWSTEPWWQGYSELAGLAAGATDLRGPWRAFAKLCRYQQGTLIFHPGGWGAGEVLEVLHDNLELDVKFWNGRRDAFPMQAAVDIFEPLPETDLRALHFRDPEGLRKLTKKEPLEVLRKIVQRNFGTATTATVRNAMMQVGIEGSAWSAWWRKARKLAETSEWFDVNGTPAKSSIRLLLSAKDPVSALRGQLDKAEDLREVHNRVRDLFIGQKPSDELKQVGVEILARFAENEQEDLSERISAWLLISEQTGQLPSAIHAELERIKTLDVPTDPSVAPELWRLFQEISGVREQERCVGLLKTMYGDTWLDEVAQHLQHAATGLVRPLVDGLKSAGRTEELLGHYAALLARPLRAPALLVTLAEIFEKSELEGDVPTPAQRAQALLSLANYLFIHRRGNSQLARVSTRMVDVLTKGKTPLLRRLLEGADLSTLRSLHMQVQRGVDDAIDHLVTDIALERDRNFFAGDSVPFWKTETIWTTKGGLERRSSELRELREEKIPANQDAIGRAASYGDLSENAEWEAAIEEQRTLTSRAREMEDELRLADLIENAVLVEDTICPGTRVAYREIESGRENRITILGPWDGFRGDDVVSYRAPLAAGLLGLHEGDQATLEVPSGEIEIEVLAIEATALE